MRIYLDNAATSFPKPAAVYAAADDFQRRIGASVGRGAYRDAVEAERLVDRCRQRMAKLLSSESPERIVFTYSATDGLNLALMGLCRAGDHVITSSVEHNSILRPLRWLRERRGIEVTFIEPTSTGQIDPNEVRSQIRPNTRLVAIQHASNVTGVVQPIEKIGDVARSHNVLTLVDAAQTLGHIQIDVSQFPVDVLVGAGHKGLLGPLGTGIVYLRPDVEKEVACYRLGGTGTVSDDDGQPASLPDRYEAGSHNAPGLAGLGAALTFLEEQTIEEIARCERTLTDRLIEGFRSIDGVTLYGHAAGVPSVGVVSINVRGFESHEVSSILDETFGIQTRAGLHCAPGVHRFLGTADNGGAVRFSPGPFTSTDHIDQAITAVRELAGAT